MSLCVGLGGVAQHACVTVATREQILGICEQERITRVRAAGFNRTGLPDEALDEILSRGGRRRTDVSCYAIAEEVPTASGSAGSAQFDGAERVRLDHHFAHACSAFLSSPFESGTIVICDNESPQISVWDGDGSTITRVDWPWQGPGFVEVYFGCAEALGFTGRGREQRFEALARFGPAERDDRIESLFHFDSDRLRLATGWRERIATWNGTSTLPSQSSRLASAIQLRLDDLMIACLHEIRRRTPDRQVLCLGGTFFENSHFNSTVRASALFERVFVPISPGDAGLSVGAALHASGPRRNRVTPFLGPSYSPEEIKATLDNCKLRYEWVSEADSIAVAVEALRRGQLVGWAEGAMEWGPRALGARSILANPFAPYVLENLNRFLKQRAAWRGYALSGLDVAVKEHFDGPDASPFMECDYLPREPRRFAEVLPGPRSAVRIQTVGSEAPPRFRTLLERFGQASGVPILVNTSFNGFREPIVCSPRDAVRVFFGAGIDVLVFDQFVIRK